MDRGRTATELRAERAALLARPELRGAALRRELTALADRFLRELLGDEPDVALLAVGGYGRAEPAPGSDLDLLLVHRRRQVARVADRVWYPVWDSGVRLDHAVRTVAEVRTAAGSDLRSALGLLDARFVAGDAGLAEEVARAVRADWRQHAPARLAELAAAVQRRAETSGELAFLLEPDLKEARGGLRDVHAMRAAAAAWVANPPTASVSAAYQLLLDVRGELHRRTGRPDDRLVMQEQDAVAAALGLTDADRLMTDVSTAARTVAFGCDTTFRRVASLLASRRSRRPARPTSGRPLASGVAEHGGEVVLGPEAVPQVDPGLPLRVAATAARLDLPVAPHAMRRLAGAPSPPGRWPAGMRDDFLAVLGSGRTAVSVMEALDQGGLLVRLLPEWAAVRCRPQRNPYHRFTVDRHLVETAVHAAPLATRVARPDLLVLAALLHDIGKGSPGDHSVTGASLAHGVAVRMGFPAGDAGTVRRLVRHHLLLVDTATRRDLADPATVRLVTTVVADRETLELLHALTEADGLATGPAAWGDWKARLVGELVDRAAAALAGRSPPAPDPLGPAARRLAEQGAPAVHVEGEVVTVVAPDRPGLLATAAGVLALHRLDVRQATATAVGPTAVSVFRVQPRFASAPDWAVLQSDLRLALAGAFPLEQRLADREVHYRPVGPSVPPRVLFADAASTQSTVVEVRARDALGLLFRVTRALAECRLNVRAARVQTLGGEVVDAFYVLGPDGLPLTDPDRRRRVQEALLSALSDRPSGSAAVSGSPADQRSGAG